MFNTQWYITRVDNFYRIYYRKWWQFKRRDVGLRCTSFTDTIDYWVRLVKEK